MELRKATSSFSLYKILFLFTLVPVIFQDLPTQEIIGSIAISSVIFFTPLIFLFLFLSELRFELPVIPKYYLSYFIITCFTAIVMMLITVLFVTKGEWYAYSEFFPAKLIKASLYNFLFFLFAYNAYYLIKRVSVNYVLSLLQIALLFLLIYGCIEIFIPYPIRLIHSTILEDVESKNRLILTGSEPSVSMLILTCVSLSVLALRVYCNKSKLITGIILVFTIGILLAVGSNGGIISILICLVFLLRKYFSFKILLLILLIAIPITYFLINFAIPLFLSDIENFSSFSTRATTTLVSLKSLFVFPLGQGYGTYVHYFPQMLLPMHKFLSNLMGLPLSDRELAEMASTGKYLGAKSGFMQEIMFNGFSAVVFFYMIFKEYFQKIKSLSSQNLLLKFILNFLGIFCIVEFAFTSIIQTAYYYLIPFLVVYKLSKEDVNIMIPKVIDPPKNTA